jgi:hypothetical protein
MMSVLLLVHFFPSKVTLNGYLRVRVFASRFLFRPCPSAYLFSINQLPGLIENPPWSQFSAVLSEEAFAWEFSTFSAMFNIFDYSACIGLASAP